MVLGSSNITFRSSCHFNRITKLATISGTRILRNILGEYSDTFEKHITSNGVDKSKGPFESS